MLLKGYTGQHWSEMCEITSNNNIKSKTCTWDLKEESSTLPQGNNGRMENMSAQSHRKYVHPHIFTILVILKLENFRATY